VSGIFNAIDISASGMTLQRRKMDVVSQNLANVETTRTNEGGPYRRKRVVVNEVKDQVPFRNVMNQAQTRLTRTNNGHLGGKSVSRHESLEVSKANAKEVDDPNSGVKLIHDPSHPDANDDGFVAMPDIEVINEMVDMMAASRAYEANTTAILTAKDMAKNALEI